MKFHFQNQVFNKSKLTLFLRIIIYENHVYHATFLFYHDFYSIDWLCVYKLGHLFPFRLRGKNG